MEPRIRRGEVNSQKGGDNISFPGGSSLEKKWEELAGKGIPEEEGGNAVHRRKERKGGTPLFRSGHPFLREAGKGSFQDLYGGEEPPGLSAIFRLHGVARGRVRRITDPLSHSVWGLHGRDEGGKGDIISLRK